MVCVLSSLAQLQVTKTLQVGLYVFYIEMLRIETHIAHLLQISKQGVSTLVHPMPVYPKEATSVTIISFGMLVGNSRATVIAHQTVHQLPNHSRVDGIVWVTHVLIVF